MKQITVNLTETQEQFLRTFAEKHYEGAKDNLVTAAPIHTVQTQRKRYIPYSSDLDQYFDENLEFCLDDAYEQWFKSEVEAVKEYYEDRDEVIPLEIKSYSEISFTDFVGVNGKQNIYSYEDYFDAYGIKLHAMAWVEHEWEDVAFFFIRDEAFRYIEYQRHNLSMPRVYTHHLGYENRGDMPHLRALLMNIGNQLMSERQ